VVAEVAAGAITRVDFTVRPEYGLAGRVRDASGNALPDRSMELYDAQGQRRGQAVTDRFGLYRMDGVPPGRYELRLVAQPGETEPMPRRGVVIARDFIFDQDLKLP
jgi:protocatechuate 3,4-dioxygenase beta subunit